METTDTGDLRESLMYLYENGFIPIYQVLEFMETAAPTRGVAARSTVRTEPNGANGANGANGKDTPWCPDSQFAPPGTAGF